MENQPRDTIVTLHLMAKANADFCVQYARRSIRCPRELSDQVLGSRGLTVNAPDGGVATVRVNPEDPLKLDISGHEMAVEMALSNTRNIIDGSISGKILRKSVIQSKLRGVYLAWLCSCLWHIFHHWLTTVTFSRWKDMKSHKCRFRCMSKAQQCVAASLANHIKCMLCMRSMVATHTIHQNPACSALLLRDAIHNHALRLGHLLARSAVWRGQCSRQ